MLTLIQHIILIMVEVIVGMVKVIVRMVEVIVGLIFLDFHYHFCYHFHYHFYYHFHYHFYYHKPIQQIINVVFSSGADSIIGSVVSLSGSNPHLSVFIPSVIIIKFF